MAELTFKSAGVSTREIDLSGPRPSGPQGTPAGIIGTAVAGPAYVPITFATFNEFNQIFGGADGEKFGPIAVNEWLKNARACTYIRVLGAGDGKKRSTTNGVVTNAGFQVGEKAIQANGFVGNNAHANLSTPANVPVGRTYFLGAFHSESNGSTIFSAAGIQGTSLEAGSKATATITFTGKPHEEKILTLVDADGTTLIFEVDGDNNGPGAGGGVLLVPGDSAAATIALELKNKINAAAIDITATNPTSTSVLMTMDAFGALGNKAIASNFTNTTGMPTSFTGGSDGNHAVPILRGVVLAPSGVILHLSGNNMVTKTAPGIADTGTAGAGIVIGRTGALTGSVNVATQEFVMLMNGFKGTSGKVNSTVVTASFDMTAPNYFSRVFNTDPLKIEEKGHYLYSHYDIHPNMAAVTGSGVLGLSAEVHGALDIAFMLTGSALHGAASAATEVDYEDFRDRFSAPISPFVISQAPAQDLFRIESINDGAGDAEKIKISIENLVRSTSDVDKFGTFDLVVRDFKDTDDQRRVLESFRGVTLDPGSDRYIGRAIGDQKVFFNFDNDLESQKIIIDGTHPVRSKFIRVVLSDAIKKKEVDASALPVGFRGPHHLATSGSLLSGDANPAFLVSNALQRVNEPPVPYRENIAVGKGVKKRADARFYWGMQTAQKVDPTQLNKVGLPNKSWNSFVKHFPTHRTDTLNMSVGNNPGAPMVGGTIVDCDEFNKNQFTLEKIKVTYVSATDTQIDQSKWSEATYNRAGIPSTDTVAKTRQFQVEDLDRVANRKYAKFTFPLQGGFDGLNIFNAEKSKMSNVAAKREMDNDTSQGGTAGSTIASFRKAVDVMGSKSDVEIQLLAIPGMRHPSVTDFAISAVESRFDAMYIMDIEERDQMNTVITSSVQRPHVLNTVNNLKNRALDTSFAAAYFPDVTVTDPKTRALVSVPPSAAVLGAYSLNDRVGHPWFAPAGFSRGSLSAVESTSVKLNRTNLDDLYDSDINPITAFPGTGITVWGQKTLLQRSSALDRINVRRLLISIRRSVRNIANSLLFEPNREETLEKFSSLVNPVLQRVQELSGVDRYKVVIDTTTTTQADVENNTIRGKIFVQPTRTVEFVALDFVVTNAGSELL